jgi:hypothetical protein
MQNKIFYYSQFRGKLGVYKNYEILKANMKITN